jgi:hypothetical protein
VDLTARRQRGILLAPSLTSPSYIYIYIYIYIIPYKSSSTYHYYKIYTLILYHTAHSVYILSFPEMCTIRVQYYRIIYHLLSIGTHIYFIIRIYDTVQYYVLLLDYLDYLR